MCPPNTHTLGSPQLININKKIKLILENNQTNVDEQLSPSDEVKTKTNQMYPKINAN